MLDSYLPLIVVLVPLIASGLIVICSRLPNLREGWTILASLLMFGMTFSMLPDVISGNYPAVTLFELSPGAALALKVDPLGIIFAISASFLWIITSFYSIGYVRSLGLHHQTRYFTSFAVCLGATMGLAFSANLLTFLIFYELLTIAAYPLVIHEETPEAMGAGRKYLAYLLTGGLLLTAAVAATYIWTGDLSFAPGGFLDATLGQGKLIVIATLFVVGLGFKAALMPLHSWLPTAMVAPTPVSGLLHAVAVVKAGVFGFFRIIGFVFGPTLFHDIGAGTILGIVCGVTIILASLLAFRQDKIKRRLAYSTIAHLACMVLGAVLLAPEGWLGGSLEIVFHAMSKITLFLCAGAIMASTGIDRISDMNGLGHRMPVTMGAFTIGVLSLSGLPPLAGFVSKWFLGAGMVLDGEPVLLAIFLISHLLSVGYFAPMVYRSFFLPSTHPGKFSEASLLMVVPLSLTAILSALLGLAPDLIFNFYTLATEMIAGVF